MATLLLRGTREIQRRSIHSTANMKIWPLVVGTGIAATAVGGKYIYDAVISAKEIRDKRADDRKKKSHTVDGSIFDGWEYQGGFETTMSIDEAEQILDVRVFDSKKTILARHKQLIIKNHPDRGGSTFLTAKINEAKDLLLK